MYLASSLPPRPQERLARALRGPKAADVPPPKLRLVANMERTPPRAPAIGDVLIGTAIYLLVLIITRSAWGLIRACARV